MFINNHANVNYKQHNATLELYNQEICSMLIAIYTCVIEHMLVMVN